MATHKPINILEAFAAPPPPLDYVSHSIVNKTFLSFIFNGLFSC